MSAKTVETLKARLAEAEAGIVGKIAARMGWVHMASVDELVTFVEEWTALHREALSEAATAERARLAGLASEEDREMVSNLIAESIRCGMWNAREAPLHAKDCSDKADGVAESLLARLAAARGEALEEAVRWAWANHERFHVDSEDEVVRDALAALFPPPGAEVGRG